LHKTQDQEPTGPTAAGRRPPKRGKGRLRLLRLVVSLSLLGWLLAKVDYASLGRILARADLEWLLLPHLLTLITFSCCVVKWRLLLRAQGLVVSTQSLARYYLVGLFFSNFLPSNVGGDVVRATMLTRRAGGRWWTVAGSSVLIERLTGLFGLFLMLGLGIVLHRRWVTSLHVLMPIGVAFGGILAVVAVLFTGAGVAMLGALSRVKLLARPVALLDEFHKNLLRYRRTPGVIVKCLGLSCIFYAASSLQVAWLCNVFPQVESSWSVQLVVFGATSLLGLLPVAVNGYGVQEGGYVVFLTSLGYTLDQSLIVAFGFRAISLSLSFLGGILFAAGNVPRGQIEVAGTTPERRSRPAHTSATEHGRR